MHWCWYWDQVPRTKSILRIITDRKYVVNRRRLNMSAISLRYLAHVPVSSQHSLSELHPSCSCIYSFTHWHSQLDSNQHCTVLETAISALLDYESIRKPEMLGPRSAAFIFHAVYTISNTICELTWSRIKLLRLFPELYHVASASTYMTSRCDTRSLPTSAS